MKKTQLTVFQSNTFTESRQDFSLTEKRIMQFVIAKIKPTDTEFKAYTIPLLEIAELADITPNKLYTTGKELMQSMLGKFIILEDKENLRMKGFNYFEELDYGEGEMTIKLHKHVHSLFLELKQSKEGFTAYELIEFMTLTSTYAQRIYELMKQYSRSKQRERTIEISELREMLGIEKNKYKLYSNFRKRILELSHKLIEEDTTLRYKWEGVTKRGRKVVAIRFYEIHISGKEKPTDLQEKAFLENYSDQEIYNEVINSYLTIKEIIKLENGGYLVTDKFDGIGYEYHSVEQLQDCIAKAITNKGLGII